MVTRDYEMRNLNALRIEDWQREVLGEWVELRQRNGLRWMNLDLIYCFRRTCREHGESAAPVECGGYRPGHDAFREIAPAIIHIYIPPAPSTGEKGRRLRPGRLTSSQIREFLKTLSHEFMHHWLFRHEGAMTLLTFDTIAKSIGL